MISSDIDFFLNLYITCFYFCFVWLILFCDVPNIKLWEKSPADKLLVVTKRVPTKKYSIIIFFFAEALEGLIPSPVTLCLVNHSEKILLLNFLSLPNIFQPQRSPKRSFHAPTDSVVKKYMFFVTFTKDCIHSRDIQ